MDGMGYKKGFVLKGVPLEPQTNPKYQIYHWLKEGLEIKVTQKESNHPFHNVWGVLRREKTTTQLIWGFFEDYHLWKTYNTGSLPNNMWVGGWRPPPKHLLRMASFRGPFTHTDPPQVMTGRMATGRLWRQQSVYINLLDFCDKNWHNIHLYGKFTYIWWVVYGLDEYTSPMDATPNGHVGL